MLQRTVFFLIVFALNGFSKVEETNSMKTALSTADTQSLVILDLDNTVMKTVQTLGSDQWFEYQLERTVAELIKSGLSQADGKERGLRETLALWKQVQRTTKMIPVEESTPELLARTQKAGIRIMGLTARPTDLSETTQKQLKSMGVDLGAETLFKGEITLTENTDVNYVAGFRGGILFSGNNKKGGMLVRLLADPRVTFKPSKIIFVDDKKRNVDSVEESLEKAGIPHVSYRYGAADSEVKAFNPEIAAVQLSFFGGIVTDRAATAILNGDPRP